MDNQNTSEGGQSGGSLSRGFERGRRIGPTNSNSNLGPTVNLADQEQEQRQQNVPLGRRATRRFRIGFRVRQPRGNREGSLIVHGTGRGIVHSVDPAPVASRGGLCPKYHLPANHGDTTDTANSHPENEAGCSTSEPGSFKGSIRSDCYEDELPKKGPPDDIGKIQITGLHPPVADPVRGFPWYGQFSNTIVRDIISQSGPSWKEFAPHAVILRRMRGGLKFLDCPIRQRISQNFEFTRRDRIRTLIFNPNRKRGWIACVLARRSSGVRYMLDLWKNDMIRLEQFLVDIQNERRELRELFDTLVVTFGDVIDVGNVAVELPRQGHVELPQILWRYGFQLRHTLEANNMWNGEYVQQMSDYVKLMGYYVDFLAYMHASMSILLAALRSQN